MSKLTSTTRFGLLLIAFFMYCLSLSAQVNSLPGLGTNDDPYRISTVAELKWMRDKVNSDVVNYGNKTYKLMANLDFSAEGDWVPIAGGSTTSWDPFKGNFDGNGKIIMNIRIGTSSIPAQIVKAGFFGALEGSVKNLGIEWSGIYVLNGAAGGIAAGNGGIINNCYTTGVLSVTSKNDSKAGGVTASNSGTIINCYSKCEITSFCNNSIKYFIASYAGGIAGDNRKGTIANCYSTGAIIATPYTNPAMAGGIVGDNFWGIISNCYSTSDVFSERSGGIAGNNASGLISNCIALNSKISSSGSGVSRISYILNYADIGTFVNNYASKTMVVKSPNTIITNFSGVQNGTQPLRGACCFA